ncbi:autotransporter outer membrane beta-barrel domain-containing protein [Halomonas sp. ML-15]|uniref:autotransporter family protein n=1 Tax=Halomonas sp. ML-15 TaxID=2773305 RepID=UPI001746F2A7|nr:autotransporter outer membrane beta-barrel domain-containing protein [Halomonas sp. ML-15]MBD3894568.1 autotransporter outer membrane beta-barrel domain-containing protein [Halomonas sp. ML-15]
MKLRRTPLAMAISLSASALVGMGSAQALAAPVEEDPYSYVPYYQYIMLDEPATLDDGYQLLAGPALTVLTEMGPSQRTLEDPLFLYVGEYDGDFPYERQNPDSIIAENRMAVEVRDGFWDEAIIVNTSEISATGTISYPEGEDDALGVSIDQAHLVGLSASDADAAKLGDLAVFASGEERVFLYNTGTIRADELGVLLISDSIDEHGTTVSDAAVVEGSLVNLGTIESTGDNDAAFSYAFGMANAELYGNIVNGLDGQDGQAVFRGLDGAIYLLDGSVLEGDIVNRGLMEGYDGIRIEDSHVDGRILNAEGATIRATHGTALSVENTSGDIVIDQRGILHSKRYLDSIGTEFDPGQAMYLQGHNVHARLSAGSVIGDIDFDGATVTLAGGEYQGTIRNRGGVFVVDGIHAIDGAYEQGAGATLRFSSDRLSGLSAQRVTLADGSTIVFGNGEAYRDGEQLVMLDADELDFNLDALNVETASGFYRVSDVRLSDDGHQLLVSYAGVDGREVARRAIDVSGASGAKAGQLRGLGNALNRVLENGDQAAVAALLDAIGDGERLGELLPDSSGANAEGTDAASRAAGNLVSSRARGVAAGDALASKGIWLKGLYAEVDQRMRDGVEGYDSDTRGFVLGADAELHNGTVLGLGWAHSNTDTSGRNGLSESEVDFDQLIAYTSRAYGNWLFDAQLSYGRGSNESLRRTMDETARADYDSRQRGVRAGAGYALALDDATTLTPRFSMDYSHLKLDAYSETGAGAMNLSLDEQRVERFELGVQAELGRLTQVNGLMVEPRLTLGIFHDLQGQANSNLAAFAFAPEDTFVVQGGDVDKTRYTAGVGVDVYSEGGFTTSLDLSHGWTDSMTANAGELTVRYDF